MAEEFVIKIIPEGSGDISTPAGGGGNGGIGDLIGVLGTAAAGIGALVAIFGDAVSSVLKPIMGILKGIARILVEFLRPIVDVLVILFRPVLALLRPFLKTFQVMMRPFIALARELSAISTQQIAAGDVSGARSTALEAASIILAPFAIAFGSVMSQMIVEAFTTGLGFIADLVLIPIQSLFELINFQKGVDAVQAARDNIDRDLANISDTINEVINNKTMDILNNLESNARETVAQIKNDMDMQMGTNGKIVNTFGSGLDSMEDATEVFTERMERLASRLSKKEAALKTTIDIINEATRLTDGTSPRGVTIRGSPTLGPRR